MDLLNPNPITYKLMKRGLSFKWKNAFLDLKNKALVHNCIFHTTNKIFHFNALPKLPIFIPVTNIYGKACIVVAKISDVVF